MHSPSVHERRTGRWRAWLADLLAARVCLALATVFAVVHGIIGSFPEPDVARLRLALSQDGWHSIINWKYATYPFIHGNSGHLLVNLAGLLLIGSRVERIGGGAKVLGVFFAGAIWGGLTQFLLAPPAQQGIPLVGASGGITALLLWLVTVAPDSRTWPFRLTGRNLGRGVVLAEAGFLAAAWLFPDSGFQPVAHACHLGGAISGWWIARRLLRPPPSLDDLRKARARRESADGPGKGT
jgi:membrane associated rhomboid family serine protease